jgi:Ca2+-binding EF-hand superfamily protein
MMLETIMTVRFVIITSYVTVRPHCRDDRLSHPQESKRLFSRFDPGGSGVIDFDKFCTVVRVWDQKLKEEDVR